MTNSNVNYMAEDYKMPICLDQGMKKKLHKDKGKQR